jgi:putative ABC transport system permease protein
MLNTNVVEEMTATDVPITDTYVTNSGFEWAGKDPAFQEQFVTMRITHEFGKTVDWKIRQGRDFSRSFASDSAGFILNEAAVKYMGLKDPIGTEIIWGGHQKFKVIGVVEDLVTQSAYDPAKQTIFLLNPKRTNFLNIKLSPHVSASEAMEKIETLVKRYVPEKIFEYSFVDQTFAEKFANEERIGKLATFFTILAVFICCLGLFGLASFVAEQRTKEIGVRKILGASIFNCWKLLSKDFVWLVFISLLIATPIGWYFMEDWLRNFEYRATISWWVFVVTGGGALIITLITVSFQSIKAAMMNPVKSLRTE